MIVVLILDANNEDLVCEAISQHLVVQFRLPEGPRGKYRVIMEMRKGVLDAE